MKRCSVMMLLVVSVVLPAIATAYIERTDNVLSDKDNALYMVGVNYNALANSESDPIEDRFRIYKIDLKDNTKTVFYEADKRSMDRLTLSPDNKYIAVTRREKDPMIEILIIDKKLRSKEQSISVPEGILSYVWSSDSNKIAYLTGTAEMGQINSAGVYIYDLKTKEKKKIAASAEGIEWAPNGELALSMAYKEEKPLGKNRTIAVNKYKSVIYDAATGKIKKETKGFHISPHGRYSVDPQYIGYMPTTREEWESTYIDFYDLKEDKVILGSLLNKVFTEWPRILWGPILWLKGDRIVVEKFTPVDPRDPTKGVGSTVRDISICDIEKNRVLKEFRGNIVGVNSDRSKLVVYHDGKFTAVDVP